MLPLFVFDLLPFSPSSITLIINSKLTIRFKPQVTYLNSIIMPDDDDDDDDENEGEESAEDDPNE